MGRKGACLGLCVSLEGFFQGRLWMKRRKKAEITLLIVEEEGKR